MQHGSSSLSKIPYVGFSPVRLQTGIQPRPSLVRTGLSARSAFTHSIPTYTWPKLLVQRGVSPQRCWFFRSRAEAQTALLSISPTALQSRGPWLANGLCCPIGSSLTTASSETLDPPIDLSITTMGLCPTTLYGLVSRGSPICSACLSPPCRLLYPGGPNGCTWLFLHRSH